MNMEDFDNILDNMVVSSDWQSIEAKIKVLGVGGGGCNAVNYMFRNDVKGCSFIVCNTDEQALRESPVPVKLHIGRNALGAGTDPTKGRNAAVEAEEQIERIVLGSETEMLFITAGMGGGTGTGASPIIAKMAKDRGVLTIAVVTLPFSNEGTAVMSRAIDGINELVKNVDSLLIIHNDKLYEYFGDYLTHEALPKADEVLATAVRGITEIISRPGYINVDFEDIKTMMKNSGMALMGCGTGKGRTRIDDAVKGALLSPLLNDFDLKTGKNLLVNITGGMNKDGLTMTQLDEINKKIEEYTGSVNKFKSGLVYDKDPQIGDEIKITVIATGFKVQDLKKISEADLGNLIVVGKDFVYDERRGSLVDTDNADLSDFQGGVSVIGYNPTDNVKRYRFEEDEMPALIRKPGESVSELECIPAIKRQKTQPQK